MYDSDLLASRTQRPLPTSHLPAPHAPRATLAPPWPAASTEQASAEPPSALPSAIQAHFTALELGDPPRLHAFEGAHDLCGAWRIDGQSLTPWVMAHVKTIPHHASQEALEADLQTHSYTGAFLLWIVSACGRERLVLSLGSVKERWSFDSAPRRPIPHLRELRHVLTRDLPHPIRLAHAAALLARKDVTHGFYAHIQRAVKDIAAGWSAQKKISAADRHELALTLVSRLIFLHFVQSKNWLPHRNYLMEVAYADAESVYRERWRPLFFDALNRAPNARVSGVIPDEIPYLNGGLFAESAVEQRYPDLDLPNALLRDLIENVFQRYAFVDDEHAGHAYAVAPQILGEVFERLMLPEERQITGAFYTPAPLAKRIWDNALDAYLERKVDKKLHQKLTKKQPLHAKEAQTLFSALWSIRVLDPAVGTGAFLLAALVSLETHMLHVLKFLPHKDLTRRDLRTHWVTHSLHGIDIQRNAVQLAELRLWLSVTAVCDNHPHAALPLPNLEHRLRVGNALLAPTWTRQNNADSQHHKLLQDLSLALARFPTERGTARHRTLTHIRALEEKVLRHAVHTRRQELHAARHAQLDLLGGDAPAPSAEERALSLYEDARGAWQQGGRFDPKLHFADVMQEGGFDIIIGNPPWGQLSTLDAPTQKQLRARYQVLQSSGGRQGAPDMSVAFFEGYVPLLSARGCMAFLFPAKALRSGWGNAWRQWMQTHTNITELTELSTHSNHGFHASVYPCIAVLRRRLPNEAPTPHPALQNQQTQNIAPANARALHTLFTPRYGVKTGCNRAFLIPTDTSILESAAVVRGKDIRPFVYRSTERLIFPHNPLSGKVFTRLEPETLTHLQEHKAALTERSDLRANMPWWTLFRVREESVGWRVAWRDIAQGLEAAVLPPVAMGGPVNLNSTYSIAVPHREDAHALCAWFNSRAVSEYLKPAAQRARNGYYRFDARVMRTLPVPHALLCTTSELRKHALSLFSQEGPPSAEQRRAWDRCAGRALEQSKDRANIVVS